MSQLSCTNKVADCNQNEIAVDSTCYQYSLSNNNSGTAFEISNDDIEGNIIGTDTNILLHECAVKCYQNSNCSAIRFNISSEDSDGGLLNDGDCYYYGYDIISKNSLPSWVDKCSSIYTKNIVDNSNNVSIGPILMDLNTGRTSDSQSQVKTKYAGSDCRRKIADDASGNIYDGQTIQDMSDWCSKNQGIDSCNNFCNNDAYTNSYCPWKSKVTTSTYVLLGLWFFLVFLMIYLYIRAETDLKKIIIMSSFSVVLIVLLIYIVYTVGVVFGYFKGKDQNDYTSNNIANISGSGTCDSSGNGLVCNPFGGSGCVNQPDYLYYGIPYYFKSVHITDSNGNKVGYCGGNLPPEGYIGQQIRIGEQGNEGWFSILETTTDVSNPPGIFMIHGADGTIPFSDLPIPVMNGDTITLKNTSQNAGNTGQFFGSGSFNDYNFCVCDSVRTCLMGTNNDENRFNTDKGYTFQMLDSVSPNNTPGNRQQLTIVNKDNNGIITKDNFVFKISGGQDIFVSCNPSNGNNNYFLIDSLGNPPTCSNSNGSRYVQTSTNTCPDVIANNTAFPSTSCTNWCSDVTDYATPKPASVWVFSAEKVSSG